MTSSVKVEGDSFKLELLDSADPDYIRIKSEVEKSIMLQLNVTSIWRIVNEDIKAKYEKAKAAKKELYPKFEEILLFHGTGRENVQSICANNLDKRCCRDVEFGGDVVLLTASSCHAARNPKGRKFFTEQFMFGCRVLIGNAYWNGRMEDKSKDHDAIYKSFDYHNYGIVAKWQTEDIYPEYLISYMVEDEKHYQPM